MPLVLYSLPLEGVQETDDGQMLCVLRLFASKARDVLE